MGSIHLQPLYDEAFFHAEVQNATVAIEQARARFSEASRMDGFSFEVVVPEPELTDDAWLAGQLVAPLVYFCQSLGAPPPACPGIFVSLFAGRTLYCVIAAEVIAWASHEIGMSVEDLVERYGTHELGAEPR